MRTLEEVNQEYTNTCTQIGDKLYKLNLLNQDIEQLRKHQVELDKEAMVIKGQPVDVVS